MGKRDEICFQIWKHTVRKSKDKDGDEEEKMFLTKASFFRECQTKAITE